MPYEGNNLSVETRSKLAKHTWDHNNILDLHKMGVHYFNPDYLPTQISPTTYLSYIRRGLTPPVALPFYYPDDIHIKTKEWLRTNFHRLKNAGIHHLGNEYNIGSSVSYEDAALRVLFIRMSEYDTVDGSFGSYLVNNFIQDYTDNIFADFAFVPPFEDFKKYFDDDIPIIFGNITKRVAADFDIICYVNVYPAERVNLPFFVRAAGLPLHRWERYDNTLPYGRRAPFSFMAGIGAAFCFSPETEVLMADGSYRRIDQVTVGDEVQTWDFDKQYATDSAVTHTVTREASTLVELTFINGEIVRCTHDHRFYTVKRGWVEAQHLDDQDQIITNSMVVHILQSRQTLPGSAHSVVDITVEGHHNFFVTKSNLLVHNCDNVLGDNPIHGPGQNSNVDGIAVGEGETLDLFLFQRYIQIVKEGGGTKADFAKALNNKLHQGWYDPTRVLFEYCDKVHHKVDFEGNPVGEPVLYPQGGPIKSISLIDEENQTLHVITGKGSEEFEELEQANITFMRQVVSIEKPEEISARYTDQTPLGISMYDVDPFEQHLQRAESNSDEADIESLLEGEDSEGTTALEAADSEGEEEVEVSENPSYGH